MTEYKWSNDWKIEGSGAACDVKNFSEYIENQARCMEQSGWLGEALHLRSWIPELRDTCKAMSTSTELLPLSLREAGGCEAKRTSP